MTGRKDFTYHWGPYIFFGILFVFALVLLFA